MNEPEEMEKILLKLNDIAKESKRVMKIKAAIGVGKIKDELIKVKESLKKPKKHSPTAKCRRTEMSFIWKILTNPSR